MLQGLVTGHIWSYDQEEGLIDRLRSIYYDGIPLSVWLLSFGYTFEKCFETAFMISYGFDGDEFRLVNADVASISLNPKPKYSKEGISVSLDEAGYGNHFFAERTMKDGQVLVYDGTDGLIYDKDTYYQIERPKVVRIISEEGTDEWPEFKARFTTRWEDNEEAMRVAFDEVEELVVRENGPYQHLLREEWARFKKEIESKKMELTPSSQVTPKSSCHNDY